MDQQAILQYIADTFAGVDVTTATEGIAAGDAFFIKDPDHDLEPRRQRPFATIVTTTTTAATSTKAPSSTAPVSTASTSASAATPSRSSSTHPRRIPARAATTTPLSTA